MSPDLWHSKRVLITGGYGFVASHLIDRLLAAGAECFTIALERPAEYVLGPGLGDQHHRHVAVGPRGLPVLLEHPGQ